MIGFILGILCLVISTFVLLPPIIQNLGKYPTISDMYWKREYHKRFAVGFLGVGLTQIFFILQVRNIFEFSILQQVATLLFVLASVCFMSLAFLEVVEEKRLHIIVIKFYIVATVLSSIIFSYLLYLYNYTAGLIAFIPILLFILFVPILILKRKIYEATLLHVLLSYPWVITFSFILLIS